MKATSITQAKDTLIELIMQHLSEKIEKADKANFEYFKNLLFTGNMSKIVSEVKTLFKERTSSVWTLEISKKQLVQIPVS